jgi:hypothetical protein
MGLGLSYGPLTGPFLDLPAVDPGGDRVSPLETLAPPSASPASATAVDRDALVAMLREKDQLLQELEAECRGLAEQLMAFQNEILKWVDLER